MEKQLTRLLPEIIIQAYKTTGLKPERSTFFNGGKACGIGAYAMSLGWTPSTYLVTFMSDKLDADYRGGFQIGFDGNDLCECCITDEKLLGHKDGQAAWEAVKGDVFNTVGS